MTLIKNDRAMLGDAYRNLRGIEALAALREDTDLKLEQYRLTDQDELANAEKRTGCQMHHSELVLRIQRLNSAIRVEQSINFANCLSLYTVSSMTGVYSYLSYVDKGWMPEFTILLLNSRKLPYHQIRGWRTILVRMLNLKALKWEGVRRVFGDAMNANSSRWERETRPFRSFEGIEPPAKADSLTGNTIRRN